MVFNFMLSTNVSKLWKQNIYPINKQIILSYSNSYCSNCSEPHIFEQLILEGSMWLCHKVPGKFPMVVRISIKENLDGVYCDFKCN